MDITQQEAAHQRLASLPSLPTRPDPSFQRKEEKNVTRGRGSSAIQTGNSGIVKLERGPTISVGAATAHQNGTSMV
jgi:hypothetical protein